MTLEEYGEGSDNNTRLMAVAESKRKCGISSVKTLQRGDRGVQREREKKCRGLVAKFGLSRFSLGVMAM